ncbi:Protein of unknown function (DUF3049 [Striga hermonthica]|uniref:FAF domain-containing protein n=1 Tax=Striga hermonthica TaxID=68872 RepID=A0A9N7N0U7_STRHE|nr:Protein of unknown function (DUF3049 [Striga hermonthica]
MAKTIKPIKTLDIETFSSHLDHPHVFSGSSFSFPSTDPNAMRDECGISSTHADKSKSFYGEKKHCMHCDSFSSVNSDNLSTCTGGLGIESFLKDEAFTNNNGKCGKPFVSFRSFRQDGRFILKEIRIPELLHVQRENGRLKLNFIQSDDDDEEDRDDDVDDDGAIDEDGKAEHVQKIQ